MNANLIHMINQAESAQDRQPNAVDLRKIWSIFIRRWRVLTGSVIVFVTLALIWLFTTTPIYTATSTVLIDHRKTNTIKSDAIVSDLELDGNTIATEVSLVQSFSVARRVVDRLKLQDDPEFQPSSSSFSVSRLISGLFSNLLPKTSETDLVVSAADHYNLTPEALNAIERVRSAIGVRRLATTYFIDISFSHANSEIAAKLANVTAQSYLDEQREARHQVAQRATTWLSERVSALRIQLNASEQTLAKHRAKFNLAKPQAGTLAEQQAAEINAQLVAARAQTVDKKAKYDQVQRILNNGVGTDEVAAAMDSETLAALRLQKGTIERQEADLLNRYGPEHPAILKVRAAHVDVKRQIKSEVMRIAQTLKTEYEFAQRKEESLEGSLKELTGGQNLNDQTIIRLRELERDVDSNRTLYETILARFKEAQQQISLQGAESRIVAPAFVPTAPSFPKKWLVLLMAIFGGGVIGAGIVALLEYLENGFTAASQAEQTLALPVLAMIPMLSTSERSIDGRIASIPEYTALRPRSPFGEAIHSTRMMTQISSVGQPPKLVLVTSSISAEGKTTIAMSLALSAAAASQQRVLLIDCDLRAQSATKRFNLFERPGLTNFLTGQISTEQILFRTNISNLTILPAGTGKGNPPDILGSDDMRDLMKDLKHDYDLIYMDAPPLLPVVDGVILSDMADKIVFVVRWRSTPRNISLRAIQLIERYQAKLLGVVINEANISQLMNYDPYNTYYHKLYSSYYMQ